MTTNFISENGEYLWWTSTDEIVSYAHTLVKKCSEIDSDVLILTFLWEAFPLCQWEENWNLFVKEIKTLRPNIKIIVIANSWYQRQYQDVRLQSADDILFVDFFLLMMYYRLIVNKESPIVDRWDPDQPNFLFLTGKPGKLNRVRLLYKLDQQGLLDRCIWSFYPTEKLKKGFMNFIPEFTEQEYDAWTELRGRNPDNIKPVQQKDVYGNPLKHTVHYGGIPYDVDLYKNNQFQLISETLFVYDRYFRGLEGTPGAWITEKTWLAIINKRPFIMAGMPGSLEKLKSMDFKTFENYLPRPDYHQILDPELRMDAIIECIKTWQVEQDQDLINNDVEHNFNRLLELATVNIQQLEQLAQKWKLNGDYFELLWLVDELQWAEWKNWYERVKDPSWPQCEQEKDFWNLPEHIQRECVETHGYQPKLKEPV